MAIKQTAHIIKGLRRDFSDSKQPKEYAIDAKNIRITNREDSSLLSITNEKGTLNIFTDEPILGNILDKITIKDNLIIFSRGEDPIDNKIYDYIYKVTNLDLKLNEEATARCLFKGDLGFENVEHIEALGVYESEDIQKVYWVDGVNQPRMINIADETLRTNSKEFDFIQELQLNETIRVEKSYSSGSFNSGVIQYAFNYYNKNGQESNIVEVTPINYISYEDRGAAPNDYVSNSFKIIINNVDTNFDYLRLYSIHRTSLDATPSVKLVTDLKADNNIIEYIDTGTIGETIDPAELLFKGGEYIIPKTLAQKDGTLFFGNIKLKNIKQLKEDVPPNNVINESKYPVHYWRTQPYYKIGNILQGDENILMFSWESSKIVGKTGDLTGYYPYKAYLNKGDNTTFQSRETYRLGIQFQDNTGKWSNPIFYNDKPVNKTPIFSNNEYLGVKGKLYITNKIVEWAISNNYKKVRPIVVYPQDFEREVVAQGILCPTIFNINDRHNGTCYAQSSWFLRPNHNSYIDEEKGWETSINTANNKYNTSDGETYNVPEYGSWAEFRHLYPLPDLFKRNAELQTSIIVTSTETVNSQYLNNLDIYSNYTLEYLNKASELFKDTFCIDRNIITFHSPEIELQKVTNIQGCKLRLVGYSEFDSNRGNIDIMLESPGINNKFLYNFYKGVSIQEENYSASRSLISGFFYLDKTAPKSTYYVGSMVYPWHSKSHLNTCYNPINETESSKYGGILKSKKISNLKYSINSTYLESDESNKYILPGNIALFNNEESLRITNSNTNNLEEWSPYINEIIYKGNIDSIIQPNLSDFEATIVNSPDEFTTKFNFKNGRRRVFTLEQEEYTYSDSEIFNSDSIISGFYTTDPISIKYKSTPHVVLYMGNSSENSQYILSTLHNDSFDIVHNNNSSYGGVKFKDFEIIPTNTEDIIIEKSYLWLAELYREEVLNKFGGNDYENNIWYPAGDSVRLNSSEDIYVEFSQGDTFFARFDSLKTYSDDLDAVNSVTEIGSFMVETRINLDARYDRNRGKQSNLVMNPNNFNLFNDVYNQKNNFFNYRIIDKDIADNTEFPNTIVWSKQKFAGADIDAWTNINMASSLDLDGTKGELTKLVLFKNEIFSFQPEAINHILFNSRVQIPTSDGVPIELTNAYKVDGARQLSSIGSSNPLAITSTDRGIYYMDNITKGIYVFNGQVSDPLSDKLGMSSWVKNQNIDLYRIDYDKINQDVYFIGTDNFRYKQCLGYSEKLGEFESFFDYNNSEIFNVKDGTYAIKSNKLYKLFEGDYNNFFDNEKQPFWVTFTHNENPFNDKIYNTLEFRADTYDYITKDENKQDVTPYWKLSNNSSLNTIKVDNEYQDTNEVSLEFNRFTPSNLKRKFRIWRANIPRDSVNKRDRIRNTWANITLKASNPSNTKTELHDLVVSYFM